MKVIYEKIKLIYYKKNELLGGDERSHIRAYAAESAFFIIISIVPCILLLLTLIQYTPVTRTMVMEAALEVFPSSINVLIVSIVDEVYSQSASVIPLTAITAMWSAGKGVLSMASGLNWVYGNTETKNYIILRIRAAAYTLLFVVSIVLTLVLMVFGNRISSFISKNIRIFEHVVELIIDVRVLISIVVLIFVFTIAYSILPDGKVKMLQQIPGASFAAVGWLACSLAFSVYVDVFDGLSDMYGSLTTIVLVMLWLYFCMYSMLLGAKINVYIRDHFTRG